MSDFGIDTEQFAVDLQTDAATLQLKNNSEELKIKER